MINALIRKFIVHYGVNEKNVNFTHEWVYVNKKHHFVEESKGAKFFKTRYELYNSVMKGFISEAPINYLEFGVYLGDSLRYWVNNSAHPDSRFYGFDTFTGLPEKWTENKPEGSYSADGKIPDINDKRVGFEVGLFSDTLPLFTKEKLDKAKKMVIHLDADLYSSTMYVLSLLLVYLKSGDIILFDDFGSHLLHEFKAFIDFKSFSGKKLRLVGATENFAQVAFIIG